MEPKRNGGREGGNYFYGAEWNGMERRQREGEGEKVRNYFYITWKNGAEWNGTEHRQGGREGEGEKLFLYYLEKKSGTVEEDL